MLVRLSSRRCAINLQMRLLSWLSCVIGTSSRVICVAFTKNFELILWRFSRFWLKSFESSYELVRPCSATNIIGAPPWMPLYPFFIVIYIFCQSIFTFRSHKFLFQKASDILFEASPNLRPTTIFVKIASSQNWHEHSKILKDLLSCKIFQWE